MKANHSNKKQQIASTHEESNSVFNKKKNTYELEYCSEGHWLQSTGVQTELLCDRPVVWALMEGVGRC